MAFIIKCILFQWFLLFSTSIYAQLDNYRNSTGSKVTYGQYVQEKLADQARQPNSPGGGSGYRKYTAEEAAAAQALWDKERGKKTPEEIAAEEAKKKAEAARDRVAQIEYDKRQATLNQNINSETNKVSDAINKYWVNVDFSFLKKLNAGTCLTGNCKDGTDSIKTKDFFLKGQFKNGIKNGLTSVSIYNSTIDKLVCTFTNNIINGNATIYFKDGAYLNVTFKNGEIFGKLSFVFTNNSYIITNLTNNAINGVVSIHYPGVGYSKHIYHNSRYITFLNAYGSFGYYPDVVYLDENYMPLDATDFNKTSVRVGTVTTTTTHHGGAIPLDRFAAWKNGDSYFGRWKNSLADGEGLSVSAEGDYYKGTFKKWKKQGTGVAYWTSGNSYKGEWDNNEMNGTGVFTYGDNTVYTGQFKNHVFSGEGIIKWSNGNSYAGGWKNDVRDGQGTLTKANGFYKKGTFKNNDDVAVKYYNPRGEEVTMADFNGHPNNGDGTYTYPNNDNYTGHFENGEPNGKGIYTLADGIVYEGDFVNGMFEGKGNKKWPDGNSYTGDFKKDKVTGKGTFKYASGNVYEGNFVNGMFEGKGVMKYTNGTVYEGDFVNDKFEGKGTMKWNEGDSYTGSWKNDDRNGEGTFTKANGFYKKGTFKDDEAVKVKYYNAKNEEVTLDEYNGIPKSGHGKIEYSNGNSYEGNLENGEPNGKGTKKWKNGNNYTGDFKNGKMEGRGIFKYIDGAIYEGDFVNGLFSGTGYYKWADGNVYTGEFENDMFNGKGTTTKVSGYYKKGEFKDDKGEKIKYYNPAGLEITEAAYDKN